MLNLPIWVGVGYLLFSWLICVLNWSLLWCCLLVIILIDWVCLICFCFVILGMFVSVVFCFGWFWIWVFEFVFVIWFVGWKFVCCFNCFVDCYCFIWWVLFIRFACVVCWLRFAGCLWLVCDFWIFCVLRACLFVFVGVIGFVCFVLGLCLVVLIYWL